MTDAHLRRIEREATHGDLGDRVRLLVERVRVGALDRERLRLAAYLGDQAAVVAYGADLETPKDPCRWITGLAAAGKEPLVRAMCAVARQRLKHWLRQNPRDRHVAGYLALVERWVLCPCEPCALACRDGELRFRELVVMRVDQRTKGGRAVGYVQYSLWFASGGRDFYETFSYCFTRSERAAIRDELVPWALGEHDPVREREEGRRRRRRTGR